MLNLYLDLVRYRVLIRVLYRSDTDILSMDKYLGIIDSNCWPFNCFLTMEIVRRERILDTLVGLESKVGSLT